MVWSTEQSVFSSSFSPRVLLVDDEPNVLKALGRTLRQESVQIITAPSGEEALEGNKIKRKETKKAKRL